MQQPALWRGVRAAWLAVGLTVLAAPASFAVAELESAAEMVDAAGAGAPVAGFVASDEGAPGSGYVAPGARVERSAFARDVVDREPVGVIEALAPGDTEISYFTELRGLEGTRVVHRWTHEGVVVAEVPFEVGGARWRVHSRKQLGPEPQGEWTVFVIDEGGRTLFEQTLRYVDLDAAPGGAR